MNTADGSESTATAVADEPALVSEAQALAYLRANPQALTRDPELLETIELAHASGNAISLIERQVEILRTSNRRLEDRLNRLVESARENEQRALKLHQLARALVRSPSLAGVAGSLRTRMREDFDIDETFLGLHASAFLRHDIEGVVSVDAEGPIARAFDDFIRTRLIECGPITEARAKLLFPKAAVPILSFALVPLEKEKSLGMIALGSREAERFQPRQGKLFLEMAAELVAGAVRGRMT